MLEMWNNLWNDESGQGLVEYVLIIALVAITLVVVITAFRDAIAGVFGTISAALTAAPGGGT